MGLFDGIKQALNIGGVSLKLAAPASISMQDPAVTVHVTLSSKSLQTVESVQLRLYRRRRPRMSNDGSEDTSISDMAKMSSPVALTMAAGESKVLDLALPLGASGLPDEMKQQMGPTGVAVTELVGKLVNATQLLDGGAYDYYVEASAKVAGTAISPSDQVQIQVIGPGQIGTAASTQL